MVISNGVLVDAIQPRVAAQWLLHGAQRAPHCAIAFEARAKGDLPHAVATLHALFRFHVCELVPQGAAGGVAKPARHSRVRATRIRVMQDTGASHVIHEEEDVHATNIPPVAVVLAPTSR